MFNGITKKSEKCKVEKNIKITFQLSYIYEQLKNYKRIVYNKE